MPSFVVIGACDATRDEKSRHSPIKLDQQRLVNGIGNAPNQRKAVIEKRARQRKAYYNRSTIDWHGFKWCECG